MNYTKKSKSKMLIKLFCIITLQLLLVSCADVEPQPEPLAQDIVVEEAPVQAAVVVEEEPAYYTHGGSKVRSEQFDKNIFYGAFADIPIPDGMVLNKRFSKVYIKDGTLEGHEVYTGDFNLLIVSERMKVNMYDHYWEMVASETTEDGTQITQVYERDERTVIALISKRIIDIRLDISNYPSESIKKGDASYISPEQSDTNPINREDLLPSSNRK